MSQCLTSCPAVLTKDCCKCKTCGQEVRVPCFHCHPSWYLGLPHDGKEEEYEDVLK